MSSSRKESPEQKPAKESQETNESSECLVPTADSLSPLKVEPKRELKSEVKAEGGGVIDLTEP